MALDDIDLADLDLFARGAPWEDFRRLRAEAPVYWNPEPEPNQGFWAITRHADIVTIGRDDVTFSSQRGAVSLEELDDEQLELRRSMLETDGARHWAIRRLLQSDFTPRSLVKYETYLRGLTAWTLDAAFAQGEFDFVQSVSAQFPIRVLARLMDVPDDMAGQLIRWSDRLVGNTDPDLADVLLDSAASEAYRHLPFRSPAALEVFAYGDELARQRLGGDGTDIVSRLVNKEPEDAQPLNERDFHLNFLLLVAAGNETTRHTISHTVKALLERPDVRDTLRSQPEMLPVAVEEFLRWASPVYHFRRTATKDVELHDTTICEGDKVVMWYASGNRDESVFDAPDEFDVTRNPNDHVTFGKGGPHFCLGNQLARLEVRILIEEFLRRDVQLRVTGPIEHVRTNFIHGIKRFPVAVA